MKGQFLIGLAGRILGVITAQYVIATATSNDVTLSGVQAALFSNHGLRGAAIARREPRLAGGVLLSSALWITLPVPIAGTLTLLMLYMPSVILIGTSAIICFVEPEPPKQVADGYFFYITENVHGPVRI